MTPIKEAVIMSDTRNRAHLSPGERAKRGPVKERVSNSLKTHKQRRPNQRVALRKEYQ